MTDDLAESIRAKLADDPNSGEIRMFGGICFTLNGNMLLGTLKDGRLMARVGEDREPAALSLPGAARMNFTGREMKGFIVVETDELTDAMLDKWIALATEYVGAIPPKKASPKKSSSKKTAARKA